MMGETMTRKLLLLPLVLVLAALTFSQTPPHGITLKWTLSASTGVSGQNVYRGTITGGPYTKLTATPLGPTVTTYEDPVVDGKTYFYVTTALSAGPIIIESPNSNEASATAPGPIPNPPGALGAIAQ
jgi:hypothetical protein